MGLRFICLGSGPSLLPLDVQQCRGAGYVIAINETYRLAPWADVLYAADYHWWDSHDGVPSFAGFKVGMEPFGKRYPDVSRWRTSGPTGLDVDFGARTLRTGGNSGYQAINLAVKLGATRILLLGYDMQPGPAGHHWHPPHHEGDPAPDYDSCLKDYATLVDPLRRLNCSVINCSRETALTCFPRLSLDEALC